VSPVASVGSTSQAEQGDRLGRAWLSTHDSFIYAIAEEDEGVGLEDTANCGDGTVVAAGESPPDRITRTTETNETAFSLLSSATQDVSMPASSSLQVLHNTADGSMIDDSSWHPEEHAQSFSRPN
jgi:hypothetical protein